MGRSPKITDFDLSKMNRARIFWSAEYEKTLEAMNVGDYIIFKTRNSKITGARVAASRINNRIKDAGGKRREYVITDNGMINEFLVARIS